MITNPAFKLHECKIFVRLGFIISNCVRAGGGNVCFLAGKWSIFAAFVSENFPAHGNDLVYGFSAFRACYTHVHTERKKMATMGNSLWIFFWFFKNQKPGLMYGKHARVLWTKLNSVHIYLPVQCEQAKVQSLKGVVRESRGCKLVAWGPSWAADTFGFTLTLWHDRGH